MTSTTQNPAIPSNSWPNTTSRSRWSHRQSLRRQAHDFTSPEYENLAKINPKKWEECRGLGRSFGYNRAEGEAETISPRRSHPPLGGYRQQKRESVPRCRTGSGWNNPRGPDGPIESAGGWLQINGEAIYATRPWTHAEGSTAETIPVRFTRKDSSVYAILLGVPKTSTIILKSVTPKPDSKIYLLGQVERLTWSQQGPDVNSLYPKISVPATPSPSISRSLNNPPPVGAALCRPLSPALPAPRQDRHFSQPGTISPSPLDQRRRRDTT